MKEKEYINVDKMADCIYKILKNARNEMIDEKNKEFIFKEYSDERLYRLAQEMTYQFNSDMNKYLHMKDHKICGNFNNIDYDYPLYITGEVKYDHEMVNAMIKRLDDEEDSQRANDDRDFLVDWFFETFGTFGISYNFQSDMSEALYVEFEKKED